ncbi:NlpC/P60 family protein [Paenibacillus thiaminolyticus]|uniref:NlpC/P60 family protein n=1 Tax=Paenibacillus thiaminolyticus TaxID=49283 RepID=UPI00232D9AA1|nr:NlpC/P60 family protein [Paenibacillus thiaminolyticus]WCF10964.1 NlpC/P60 family protein [Paenibacillus thiaminolyticus]
MLYRYRVDVFSHVSLILSKQFCFGRRECFRIRVPLDGDNWGDHLSHLPILSVQTTEGKERVTSIWSHFFCSPHFLHRFSTSFLYNESIIMRREIHFEENHIIHCCRCFKGVKLGKGISHAGIYMGDGLLGHASVNKGAEISELSETYYATRYVTARRILSDDQYRKRTINP